MTNPRNPGRPRTRDASLSHLRPVPPAESLDVWLHTLSSASAELGPLFERPEADQRRLGYYHTLREIAQQPLTWPATARLMVERRAGLEAVFNAGGQPPHSVL